MGTSLRAIALASDDDKYFPSSIEIIVPRFFLKQGLNSLRIQWCQQGERDNSEECALMQEKTT